MSPSRCGSDDPTFFFFIWQLSRSCSPCRQPCQPPWLPSWPLTTRSSSTAPHTTWRKVRAPKRRFYRLLKNIASRREPTMSCRASQSGAILSTSKFYSSRPCDFFCCPTTWDSASATGILFFLVRPEPAENEDKTVAGKFAMAARWVMVKVGTA